ncbi:ABC transporter substrate-binding protein [Alkaliphilus serpentinus]|uniref:Extracellular solute-binding protein n=1 Tax=Alkaliphilus serpentinus TaxID=1482731 RepID=A0A833HRR9_9FIRM|nr:extracellular solute-binding protein [Alkaliphilus serpentinus]KAB3533520.1 extracellular solute-binding protein [Alkaliphilus serpentinus]
MNSLRKLQIKFLLFILLFIFIILGPFYFFRNRPLEVDFNESQEETYWRGIISLWDYPRLDRLTGTQYRWIREKINSFERKYPGVYIDLTPIDWEKGPVQLETALKLGNPPDILPVGSDYTIIASGKLEALDQYMTVDEIRSFRQEAIRAVTYNGKILAMPWMMNTYGLLLNLDIFQQRGVEPPKEGIWTYEEFVEKLQLLTFDSKGGDQIDYYGFNSFVSPGYYNLWGIFLSDGATVINEELAYVFNGDLAISGLNKVMDLKYQYHVTHPAFGENTSNQVWESFYKDQRVAVIPSGTWALNVLENLRNSGNGFSYGVALFPTGALGKPVSMSNTFGSYGISHQEEEEKLKMCVAFLKHLVEDDHQQQLYRLGVFPVKSSVGNIYMGDPMMSMLYTSLENTIIIPPHPYWKDIDAALQKEIHQGLLGKKNVPQLLKDAEDNIKALINLKMRN